MLEATPETFPSGPGEVRQLLLVSPSLLPQVWPQVEPLFLQNRSVWEEYYTIDSLLSSFVNGKMQLWTLNNEEKFLLAWVTELVVFPKAKVLYFPIIVGEVMLESLQLIDCVEMWARKHGATKSVIIGRRGLSRVLKPYGYEQHAVALSKSISEMTEH